MLLLKNTLKSTTESLFLLSLLAAFTPTHAMKDDKKEEGAPRSVPTLKNIVKDKILAQQNPTLHYELALQFEEGTACKKDFRLAVTFYQAAADQGHAGSQFNLAVRYEKGKGKGIEKDERKAANLYQQAAIQDYGPAVHDPGCMKKEKASQTMPQKQHNILEKQNILDHRLLSHQRPNRNFLLTCGMSHDINSFPNAKRDRC